MLAAKQCANAREFSLFKVLHGHRFRKMGRLRISSEILMAPIVRSA